MVAVQLNRLELFKLFSKHQLTITEAFLSSVADHIEQTSALELRRPIGMELRADIRTKAISLKTGWCRQQTEAQREQFHAYSASASYKLILSRDALVGDTLYPKLVEATQELAQLKAENKAMLEQMIRLKSQLAGKLGGDDDVDISKMNPLERSNYVTKCISREKAHAMIETAAVAMVESTKKVEKWRRRRSNFFEVSTKSKQRLKKVVKEEIGERLGFVKAMGLCVRSVQLGKLETEEPDFEFAVVSKQDLSEERKPTMNNLLFYKDKFSISDHCYANLKTRCFLPIPSIFALKKRRAQLDNLFEIHNNEMGVYVSFREKLVFRLQKYFERKYGTQVDDDALFRDRIVHVKLSADGTNIGRNLKLLNFTFCVLNEGARAKRATGNYSLGIFEIENEQHGALAACFRELIDEFERVSEVEVCGRRVRIVYYYGADWKMLAIVLGLQGANARHPCLWCKCDKEDFYRTDQDWSIVESELGARSHEERNAILAYQGDEKKKLVHFGYAKPALFRSIIPNFRYMIDMLHLYLRISDTLFNLLVKDCSLADNFDMCAISKFELAKYKHMNSLQHFLNERCNVRFQFTWIAETKKLTWRDLVGPEKTKLFENFSLVEIMPVHEKFDSLVKIWLDFYEIVQLVKTVQIDAVELKERTAEWLRLYLTVYARATVTPYMHAFVAHLAEFVHLYKDINAFNCQGLEKLNDMTTGQFFKGTNKHDTALHQILKKRNRMEFLATYTCEFNGDEQNDDDFQSK